MKRGPIIIVVIVALVLLAPIGWPFLWVFGSLMFIKVDEAYLKRPSVYEPVGETLALYCQSDSNLVPERINYAWFPHPLRKKRRGCGYISEKAAGVEMGGGFYHYGYRVVLDESASDATTNVWSLYFHSEGARDKQLLTLKLPSSRRLSSDELLEKVLGGFDERLAKKPRDIEAYKGKVQLLLRHGKVAEARGACREWTKRMPNHWLPRLTYAHVSSRLGETDAAGEELAGWVSKHENFAHYIYLVLFNMREGREQASTDAIQKALDQPFVEPRGSQGNKFYLGHNAAVFAYMEGDYNLCLAMCNKMLADKRKEESMRRRIFKIKAATQLMLGSQKLALESLDSIPKTERATWGVTERDRQTYETFVSAIRQNRKEYVRRYQNWRDELWEWFCPYNVRGRCLLYSEEWNEGKGFSNENGDNDPKVE